MNMTPLTPPPLGASAPRPGLLTAALSLCLLASLLSPQAQAQEVRTQSNHLPPLASRLPGAKAADKDASDKAADKSSDKTEDKLADTAPEPEPLELTSRPIAKVVPPPWNYRPPVVLPPPPPPQMPEPVTVRSSNLIACVARRTLDGEDQRTSITCRNASTLRQTVYLRIQASNVAGLPTPEAERNGHLLNPGETRTLVALEVVAQPAQVAFTYSHQPRP